jgi:hypothetical protein
LNTSKYHVLEPVDSEILTLKYNKNKAAGVWWNRFNRVFNDLPFISTQQDLGLRGLRSYFVQASARRLVELHHVFRGLLIKILVKLQKTQPYIFHIFARILFKTLPINYKIRGGWTLSHTDIWATGQWMPPWK